MTLNKKLGLGTVQFGLPYGISNNTGQTSSLEVREILNTAKSFNIEDREVPFSNNSIPNIIY